MNHLKFDDARLCQIQCNFGEIITVFSLSLKQVMKNQIRLIGADYDDRRLRACRSSFVFYRCTRLAAVQASRPSAILLVTFSNLLSIKGLLIGSHIYPESSWLDSIRHYQALWFLVQFIVPLILERLDESTLIKCSRSVMN